LAQFGAPVGITLDPHVGRRGKLVRRRYNFVAPIEQVGEPVTSAPDVKSAAP
jgi:hypothetical protein